MSSLNLYLTCLVAFSMLGQLHGLMNITRAPYVCDFAKKVIDSHHLRIHLWGEAQKEMGMVPNYRELAGSEFINEFFGGKGFGFSAYNVDNKPVFYHRIWKNGNSAIRNSFWYALKDKNIVKCPTGTQCDMTVFDYEEKDFAAMNTSASKLGPISLFTFIRRPVSHFISGLREYYFLRDYHDKQVDVVPVQELAHFLRDFIDVANPEARDVFVKPYRGHLNLIPHVYPQATTFREEYGQIVIGRMENFQSDWDKMQTAFGITMPSNKEFGTRVASLDLNKITEAII